MAPESLPLVGEPAIALNAGVESFAILPKDSTWVFLTCFNRKNLSEAALDSLLAQSAGNLCIIVSDNSTTDEIETWISVSRFSRPVHYVHWKPTLTPPYGHLSQICSIVDAMQPAAWMIFHDDDYALPKMVEELRSELDRDASLSAVAGNAIDFNARGPLGRFRKDRTNVRLDSVPQLLSRYFLPSSGVSPCPAYLFRSIVAGITREPFRGGKYVDIWTNASALRFGAVLWLEYPVMLYRRHDAQDSASHSCRDKFALFDALVRKGAIDKEHRVYRWFFIQNFKHHRRRISTPIQWHRSRAFRLAGAYLARSLLDPVILSLIIKKLFWRRCAAADRESAEIFAKFNDRVRRA